MRSLRQLVPGLALAWLIGAGPTIASAPANATALKSVTGPWKPAVPFIEDDFGRALALAKERKLPVFIEGWAPW
jgi:hypothetical protein